MPVCSRPILTCTPGSALPHGESPPQVHPNKTQSYQYSHEACCLLNRASEMNLSIVIALAFALPLLACTGDISDLGKQDSGAMVDMAEPPGDGGGAGFLPQIAQDVVTLGCTGVACHGGTQTPILKDGDNDNN